MCPCVCSDDALRPALLGFWGVTLPGWLCVVAAQPPTDWVALLDDRLARIGQDIERLPRASDLPDDHLLVYSVDKSLIIARPALPDALSAIEQPANTQRYMLLRQAP